MHSVITEDDTGHMDMQKETNKRRGTDNTCANNVTQQINQVKQLHILRFSRILYKIFINQ